MPYLRGSSSGLSVKSKGTTSINSVHPEELPDQAKERTVCSQYLFCTEVSKAKKSFSIEVSSGRTIYVQQYAQKEEHLFDENNPIKNDSSVVLFLIHGVGGSSDMWDAQIHYFLNEGYEIVSLDLLGHGKSSKPSINAAYLFDKLANDVLYVFDMFCKRRNVVIGHSYGSSFCTFLSKERGHSISKMVLISGGGPTTLMPDRCSAFCLPMPMFYLLRPALVKMFRRMAFHVNTNERIRNKIATFGISSHVLKAVMQGQHWSEADEQYHADLLVPVLLVYGKGDQFVSYEDEVWMNETLYGSELEIIENAGHMVMVEAPTIVNIVIHKFLNRDVSTRLGHVQTLEGDEDEKQAGSRFSRSKSSFHSRDGHVREREDSKTSVQVRPMSAFSLHGYEKAGKESSCWESSPSAPPRAASRLSQMSSTRSIRHRRKTML